MAPHVDGLEFHHVSGDHRDCDGLFVPVGVSDFHVTLYSIGTHGQVMQAGAFPLPHFGQIQPNGA